MNTVSTDNGRVDSTRPFPKYYFLLVGIVLLSVVLQFVDVPDRTPDREQRLRVAEAQAPARVSARERAESLYEQGREVQDQRAIER